MEHVWRHDWAEVKFALLTATRIPRHAKLFVTSILTPNNDTLEPMNTAVPNQYRIGYTQMHEVSPSTVHQSDRNRYKKLHG